MMRKVLWLSFLTAVCGITRLHADITIVEQIAGEGAAQDGLSTLMIKDGRARIDAPVGASMILDLKSGDIIRLMPARKSYIKIPGPMAKAAFDAMKKTSGEPKHAAISLEPTGKKDMINGYAADEYTYGAGEAKTTLWLSKAVPDYAGLLKEMSAAFAQGPMGAMLGGIFDLDLTALPGFPIRTSTDLQPGQANTSTVLSISAKPIADSEFDIPADYTPVNQ